MKKFPVFLSVLCLTASLMIPASAAAPLEYTINGPGDPEYGKPTSFEVIHTPDNGARKNEDVSKNAALARRHLEHRHAPDPQPGSRLPA